MNPIKYVVGDGVVVWDCKNFIIVYEKLYPEHRVIIHQDDAKLLIDLLKKIIHE